MDKSWMKEPKFSESYLSGVQSFMQFVSDNMGSQCTIRCPCRICCNAFLFSQDEVEDHLILKGISESYTNWIYHGEQSEFSIPNVKDQDYGHTSHHDDGSIDHEHEPNDGLHDMLEDRFPGRDEVQIENSLSASFDIRKSEGEVTNLRNQGVDISDQLYALACRPDQRVKRFTGCIVNGIRFHTRDRDSFLKSQNSGVLVEGNHETEDIDFFGILTNIYQLDYIKDCHAVVFKCNGFDIDPRKKRTHRDGHLLSINVNKCWYGNDPFVLAFQARQVFYLPDTKLGKDWRVVQKFNHRHVFDVPEVEEMLEESELDNEIYQEIEISETERFVQVEEFEGPLNRTDIDPNIIDAGTVEKNKKSEMAKEICSRGEDDDEEEDETIIEYCSERNCDLDGDEESDLD
ncbi:hypothetical protein CCACVL1_29911 [Corchorus capsularis]|uniref:Transposase-associated domain-containing protein n=1 Tax=Corchorus capsularis TaxID=210143 RepID=A0A1R3FZI7_COCAP|nr:hypothetical protein CCACVL1_29911 [Corchorus capsularis]